MKLALVFSMTFVCLLAQAQYEGANQTTADLSLAPGGVSAKNFPAYQSSVKATETLDSVSFDFIHGILASGRLHESLRCRIEIRALKEERKFSTGSQLVEALEITLHTDQFGPRSIKFNFPMGSRLGRRIVNNQNAGPVEEIKIETPEPYENWFQFQHDGKRLVWAEIGSMYQFATCLLRE